MWWCPTAVDVFLPSPGCEGGADGRVRLTVSAPCPGAVVCFGVPCCAVLCCAVSRRAVPRCALLRSAPLRRAVPCRVVSCCALLCCGGLRFAVLRRAASCCERAVLRGGVVCCAAVWRAVLRCVVLCCALLCRAMRWLSHTVGSAWGGAGAGQTGGFALSVAGSGLVVGWQLVGVVWLGVARWVLAAGGLNDCRLVRVMSCCALLCGGGLPFAVLRRAASCSALPCCGVVWCVVLPFGVLCCIV